MMENEGESKNRKKINFYTFIHFIADPTRLFTIYSN